MSKVKVTIGYHPFIMDAEAAFTMFRGLNGASVERLESTYSSETKTNIYSIQSVEQGFVTISNVSDEDYAIWKLAGASK